MEKNTHVGVPSRWLVYRLEIMESLSDTNNNDLAVVAENLPSPIPPFRSGSAEEEE